MKIAIVGFDVEGKATYDYLLAMGGHEITICDQNTSTEVPAGAATRLGDGYLDGLDAFEVIVRTPGLQPQKILDKNPGVEERITSHTNLFFGGTPTQNVIGVTGTKGKGTTTTLIGEIMKAAGKDVYIGGNIGVPPLTFVNTLKEDSWVVLELSSFQLSDCRYSPHIAVCLMVVPEHLNWHVDMKDYAAAKEQLFAHQQTDDIAIYNADNETSYQIASAGLGQVVPFMSAPGAAVENDIIAIDGQEIINVAELKLLGKHNWQNVCAAVTAVWQAGIQDAEVIRGVLQEFKGLPHRLELVRTLDDVDYYNDSFSSGLHSTEAAVLAIPKKQVLVVGGFDRMLDIDWFGEFAASQADSLEKILLIGQSAERTAAVLQAHDFTDFVINTEAKTMAEVVAAAKALVKPGQAVLFSPGFASFDMFKNFEDRGNQFRDGVNAL